jgi:PGF-CTERM protein
MLRIRGSAFATACALVLLSTVAFAGTGTAAAQEAVGVSDPQELQNITEDPDGDYVLTEDIDASDIDFEAIGDRTTPFTGTLDGNGHTVSGLTVGSSSNRPIQDTVGLFGVIGENGSVEGIGIEDATVVGYQDVGGLAGINNGEVARSYVDADVGGFAAVGGLVGNNDGRIMGSYSTGEVNATGNSVGGVVGTNVGNVTEAYAGTVLTVSPDSTATGGAVGAGFGNSTNVYWDTNVSGTTESGAGTGLTTEEMTGERATESMEGFGFDSAWRTTEGYPVLGWQPEGAEATPPDPDDGTNGDGDDDGDGDDGTGTEDGTDGNGGTDEPGGSGSDTGGSEGMPGFGVLAAFAALVCGAFLHGRAR